MNSHTTDVFDTMDILVLASDKIACVLIVANSHVFSSLPSPIRHDLLLHASIGIDGNGHSSGHHLVHMSREGTARCFLLLGQSAFAQSSLADASFQRWTDTISRLAQKVFREVSIECT